MPKYEMNFILTAWCKNIEIEADNEQKAMEQLDQMSVEELAEYGYFDSELSIDNLDVIEIAEERDADDYPDTAKYRYEI